LRRRHNNLRDIDVDVPLWRTVAVQRFLVTRVCSVCHGTRLRPEALTSQLGDRNIAEIRRSAWVSCAGPRPACPPGCPAS